MLKILLDTLKGKTSVKVQMGVGSPIGGSPSSIGVSSIGVVQLGVDRLTFVKGQQL